MIGGLAAAPALGAGVVPAGPAGAASTNPVAASARTSGPVVPGTSCPKFPPNNYWNTPIATARVHRKSARWVSSIGTGNLHPDFGPSFGEQELPYGIPVTVVAAGHPLASVEFEYADESDRVGYPLGTDTLIEGGSDAGGDRHAIIVDAATCNLYETWDTHATASGWQAGSGAVWNLRSNRLRPRGWTSADAAGLPILPGLLSYDEVAAGFVGHAIRFTAPRTSARFIWPARHRAASGGAADPPMGARFRLRADFPLAGWSQQARVVLQAMKDYGLVLADNGSGWFFQGTADERWPIELVDELKGIPASAFQAVNTAPMRVSANSGRARTPR